MDTPNYANEIWKTIPFAPDYAASSMGRIRRVVSSKFSKTTVLKQSSAKSGYLKIKLFVDGVAIHPSAHRCICSAFHGTKPSPAHVVAHWDGVRTNNAASNLRWATPKENGADQSRHGKQKGEGHNMARLTNQDVIKIRKDRTLGKRVREIAAAFDLDIKHTYRIINREVWSHI